MKRRSFLFSSLVCFSILPELLFSLPQKPSVASGDVSIQNANAQTMVIKASDRSIIDYRSFDIQKGEKVKFIQPSSSSAVLNRVKGKKVSKILGQMESNGKILLVNPNGMYFGPHSSVRCASLIASTLDISNDDFIKGQYNFLLQNKERLSEIRNDGLLAAEPEGSIVLMAPIIRNFGTIQAKAGKVVLASGEKVTLDFHGDGMLQFTVEGDLKGAIVEHLGTIQAEGGEVHMHLPTAKKAIHEVVNKDGIERGEVFVQENGEIFLVSSSSILAKKVSLEASTLSIDGNIDVSSSSEKGGEIRLAGADISVRGAKMDASGWMGGGDVYIGGEYQGGGNMAYASKVSMDESSHVIANAIEEGNGGKVVLWSTEETDFSGNIFAQGGFQKGNGGTIETSSFDNLMVGGGVVNTSAPSGSIGEWLLDPGTIIIDSAGGANPGCVSSGVHVIDVAVIESAVSNVSICADLIVVNEPITMANQGVGILFTAPLRAAGFMELNGGSITTTGGVIVFNNLTTRLTVSAALDTTGGGTYPVGAFLGISTVEAQTAGINLSLNAGTSSVAMNNLGIERPLNNLNILYADKAVVNSISLTGNLMTSAPLVVERTSTFNIGGNIDVSTIDSLLPGESSLVIQIEGALLASGFGTAVPFGGVTILDAAPGVVTGSIFTQNGDINILPSMALNERLTIIKTYSQLNNYLSGSVQMGDILPSIDGTQSLEILTGLRGTISLGDMGTPAYRLNKLSAELNQDFSVGDIYSVGGVLISTGGSATLNGTVVLDDAAVAGLNISAAKVYLGGPITTPLLNILSTNFIVNQSTPYPITITDPTSTTTLNALKQGYIGTQASPIEIDAEGPLQIGGATVWLSGDHENPEYIAGNKPCLLFVRKTGSFLPCFLARRQIFDSLPKTALRGMFISNNPILLGLPETYHEHVQNSHFRPIQPRSDFVLPNLTAI